MKRIFIYFLFMTHIGHCLGCTPIEGKWEKLPIIVCPENKEEEQVINDFNVEATYNLFKISNNECQITFSTKDLTSSSDAGLTIYHWGEIKDGIPLLNNVSIIITTDQWNSSIDATRAVIAHELGHALGHFYHTNGEHDLMRGPGVFAFPLHDLMNGEFSDWLHATYPESY